MVMRKHGIMILHAMTEAGLRVLDGPAGFPVIENTDFRCLDRGGIQQGIECFQHFTDLGYITENPCVIPAGMGDDSTVEHFRVPAALTPLEVLHAAAAVCDSLHGGEQMHARTLQLVDRLPVDVRRRRLHQQERLIFQRPHDVMVHGIIAGGRIIIFPGPERITVPGDHINGLGQGEIIIIPEAFHEVGGHRDGRICRADRFFFHLNKDSAHPGGEASPVQNHGEIAVLTDRRRRLDLRPGCIAHGPEIGIPGLVQGIQRLIFFLKPLPEARRAQRAAAVAGKLVGDMPEDDTGMGRVALGKRGIHLTDFLPVDRRGRAVVMPLAKMAPLEMIIHTQDFGIFFCHPGRPGTAGRSEHDSNAVVPEAMDDLIHP